MKKGMKCELCGKGHHIRFCKLPGAAKYRRLKKATQIKKVMKQSLKKPSRFSTQRSKGLYRKKTNLAYSGKNAVHWAKKKDDVRLNPVCMRRPAQGDANFQYACNKAAIQEMSSAGYVNIPSTCPTCNNVGYLVENTSASKKATQVQLQCDDYDCRARFSALSFSAVLPSNIGRGLTPAKVNEGIKIYTSAGVQKPPSPQAAAKQIQCGRKSMTRLFAALQQKESQLGTTLDARTKLATNVEVDGHLLRTGRISHKTAKSLYPHLIVEWEKKHRNETCPKYWLMPLTILGAWERGSDKGTLASGRLKLSAPASKPGTEGLQEVRGSALFSKIKKNTVIFPDGAVVWETVAKESNKGLRVAPVVHQKQQFVIKDRRAKKRGASNWRGTQVIDRRWDGIDSWIGRNVATLKNGRPNIALMAKVRSYQWRVRQADVYTNLGKACKGKSVKS